MGSCRGEVFLHQRVVHQRDHVLAGDVGFSQVAATQERDAEGMEQIGIDHGELACVLFRRRCSGDREPSWSATERREIGGACDVENTRRAAERSR